MEVTESLGTDLERTSCWTRDVPIGTTAMSIGTCLDSQESDSSTSYNLINTCKNPRVEESRRGITDLLSLDSPGLRPIIQDL